MRFLPAILLLGIPVLLLAEPPVIYKSVDEQGRVTYSSEPVKDAILVEEVQTAPAAAPAQDAGNARDRTEAMMEMANELERGRLEKEKQRTEEQRERQRLEQQKAQLEQQQKLLEEMQRYNDGWAGGRFWPYPPAGRPLPMPPRPPKRPKPPKPKPLPLKPEPGAGASFPPAP